MQLFGRLGETVDRTASSREPSVTAHGMSLTTSAIRDDVSLSISFYTVGLKVQLHIQVNN
jgi:hypothetical protein